MTSFYTENELKGIGLKEYGTNVLISRNASIYGAENIVVGNNVRIDDFCILSGNIVLKSNIHIAAYCALFGGKEGIVLEDFAGLSSRCVIYAESDDYTGNYLTNPTIPEKYRKVEGGRVVLSKHVIVGTGTSIMPSVFIGEGVSIGSMSFVSKSLDAWGIYVGCPCRKIKERSRKLLALEEEYLGEVSMHEQI